MNKNNQSHIGMKKKEEKRRKKDLGHNDWYTWHNMIITLFFLQQYYLKRS